MSENPITVRYVITPKLALLFGLAAGYYLGQRYNVKLPVVKKVSTDA